MNDNRSIVIKRPGILPENGLLLLPNEHELHFVPAFVCSDTCTETHIWTIWADTVTAAQIRPKSEATSPSAMMNTKRHKYALWILAGPGLAAYLEIHLCGRARDGVYEKNSPKFLRAAGSLRLMINSQVIYLPSQLWPLHPRSSSWFSSTNKHTLT